MAVSGVRSSWLASATKRRSRSSEAVRSAKAVSIWLSMAFSARPSRPISVSGPPGEGRLAGAQRGVEREAEPADLGVGLGGLDPAGEVAAGDVAGGGGDAL